MMKFYSPGKILLTGEYLVLQGAKALAVPTRFGQELSVSENKQDIIHWLAKDPTGKVWFEAKFKTGSLDLLSHSDIHKAMKLQVLLNLIQNENKSFFEKGLKFESKLEFFTDWGLGSSSTFVNNLSQWSGVNAYRLHDSVSKGSGYDIAVALEQTAIIYQNKKSTPIEFQPAFSDRLFFVYLGTKADTENAVKQFLSTGHQFKNEITEISEITERLTVCSTLDEFEKLITQHEEILSSVLQQSRVQASNFSDYNDGVIKSLGAWGGDFILVTGHSESSEYFRYKGHDIIFPYSKMIAENAKSSQ